MGERPERQAELQFLINVAEDLLVRLEIGGEVASRKMGEEARELVVAFRGWLTGYPDEAVQVAIKKRLYDLQQQVMDASPISSLPFRES